MEPPTIGRRANPLFGSRVVQVDPEHLLADEDECAPFMHLFDAIDGPRREPPRWKVLLPRRCQKRGGVGVVDHLAAQGRDEHPVAEPP